MPAFIPLAAAAVSAVGANRAAKKASQGSTSRVELDPRMQGILYGDGQRVLRPGAQVQMGLGTEDDYRRMLDNEHREKYGIGLPTDQASTDWMTQAIKDRMEQGQQVQINPDSDFMDDNGIIGRISGLLDDPQSPGMSKFGSTMDNYLGAWGEDNFARSQHAAQRLQESNVAAPTAQAARVNAPSQNNLNLAPAYQDMVYGTPGSNPHLMGGIQKGINQSTNAFSDMLTDATRRITRDVLPSIRGGAVVNGMMGSSRQGIAERGALEDFSTQMMRAAGRFGQGNTDAAVAAQAGAYDTDRNRSLAAMSGLGAHQYGVAQQDAQMQQQANLASLQSQLATNELNAGNQRAGIGLSAGLLDTAYKFGGDADSYNTNKIGKVSSMLTPFTGFGAMQTTSTPMYSNTGANLIGGAMMGQQLAKGFGFGATPTPSWTSGYDLQ